MGSKTRTVLRNPVISWREVVRIKRELGIQSKEVANGDDN